MKVVYTADDPIQAHAIRNFLEEEGIPAVVVGEGVFPLRGYGASCAADSLPQVWVTNDEDAPRARELLRAHQTLPSNAPHPCAVPAELGQKEGRDEEGAGAPEELTARTGRRWVRWFILVLLCWAAAGILIAVWSLLSIWLGVERR